MLFGFVAAVTLLMLMPGPNVALIIANSVAYGARFGLLTVAGTCSAMVVQLGLTGLGLTEALGVLGHWFAWLRWVGVVYLFYLGVMQWRAPVLDLTRTRAEPRSVRAVYMRAFFVSLTNPKTLLFYGAFFPQFVDMTGDVGRQVFVLSAVFLVVAGLVDSGWAFAAGKARGVLAARGRLRNRVSGGMLIGAGTALALPRVK